MTLECAHQTWKRVRLGFPSTNFYLWWAYNVVFLFGFLVTNAACVRLDHPTQTLPKINIAPPLKLDDWKMIHVLLRQEANFHVFLLLVSSDVSGRISLTSAKSTNQICARSSFASMLLMPQTSKRKSWLWRVLPKFCWFSCRLVFIHCFFYLNIYIYIFICIHFLQIYGYQPAIRHRFSEASCHELSVWLARPVQEEDSDAPNPPKKSGKRRSSKGKNKVVGFSQWFFSLVYHLGQMSSQPPGPPKSSWGRGLF